MKTDTIDRVNGDDQRKGAGKMTSNEALEKLLHLHICYDCTADKDCCKTCDSRLCYEAVKKDLEVLEILKRHLVVETEDDERKELGESVNCYLKSWLSSDKEDYQKVKEWLERKGNKNE